MDAKEIVTEKMNVECDSIDCKMEIKTKEYLKVSHSMYCAPWIYKMLKN